MPRIPHLQSRRTFLGAAAASLAGCAGLAPAKTGMAPVPGGQLYFEEAGSGPPVVLIHGFTLDTRMWDDQFAALAARHRVIRYDLRGFGRSSLPTGPYVHADDCVALLSHLGVQQADLVGLSAGGRVALDTVLKHPTRVRRLVLIDTFVGGYVPTQGYRDSFGAMIAAARGGDVAKARQLWLSHPLFAPAAEQPAVRERLQRMVQDYSGFHWSQANPEVPLAPPASGRLAEVRAPTLLLTGQRDIEDVQTQARLLERGITGLRSVTLPGVGHMSNMEAPAAVNRALLAFLA